MATLGFAPSLQATVIDGGFETPVIGTNNWTLIDQSQFTGWKTTASDHKIELWSTGFSGVTAFQGNQFAEINANMQSTLYQDITGVAVNEKVSFTLAHRGRLTTEAMQFTITDLGTDGIYGTADDTTLFSKTYSDGTSGWGSYSSATESAIITKGNAMRLSFASLVPGSYGNFLDGVSFSATPMAMAPEPGTWAALSLLCFASFGQAALRRMGGRKMAKNCR